MRSRTPWKKRRDFSDCFMILRPGPGMTIDLPVIPDRPRAVRAISGRRIFYYAKIEI